MSFDPKRFQQKSGPAPVPPAAAVQYAAKAKAAGLEGPADSAMLHNPAPALGNSIASDNRNNSNAHAAAVPMVAGAAQSTRERSSWFSHFFEDPALIVGLAVMGAAYAGVYLLRSARR